MSNNHEDSSVCRSRPTLVDLPLSTFDLVFKFLTSGEAYESHACMARVQLQLTCSKLHAKVRQAKCYRTICHAKLKSLIRDEARTGYGACRPPELGLCAGVSVCNPMVSNSRSLGTTETWPPGFRFPPSLWHVRLNNFPDGRLLPLPSTVTRLSTDFFEADDALQRHCIPGGLEWFEIGDLRRPLQAGDLPSGLRTLRLIRDNRELRPGVLPAGLRSLSLDAYNQTLDAGILPSSLRRLWLLSFRQILSPGVLPAQLTRLTLRDYNRPLTPGVLPEALHYLRTGKFNKQLASGSLPASLVQLRMEEYRQPLEPGVLPAHLEFLRLDLFNRPLVAGSVPPSVRRLILPKFNRDVDALPVDLHEVCLGHCDLSDRDRRNSEEADVLRTAKTIEDLEESLAAQEEVLESLRREIACLRGSSVRTVL